MSQLFGVTSSDGMRAAGQKCLSTNIQIQTAIGIMVITVQNLIDDGATGTDINQLETVKAEWQQASSALNNGNGLITTANNYDNNMATNTTNMTVVGSSLPAGKF
jgi:hypothetical protein